MLRSQMIHGISIDPSLALGTLLFLSIDLNNNRLFFANIDTFTAVIGIVTFKLIQSSHDFYRITKTHYLTDHQILTAIYSNQTGKADRQMVEKALAVGRLNSFYFFTEKTVEIFIAFQEAAVNKKIWSLGNCGATHFNQFSPTTVGNDTDTSGEKIRG